MTRDIKNRLKQLRDEILEHDRCYYVLNQPKISDQDYDTLYHELVTLETQHPEWITPDSPTQRVAETPIDGFQSVLHTSPMLSIDNTYSEEELLAFDKRVQKHLASKDYTYIVEPKIDGLALNLHYEQGLLTIAATRGNGTVGDDVTSNVRTIRMIPLKLNPSANRPDILDIRGEVYMPDKAFTELNLARQEAGEAEFANPRNAAAGSLKLLDPRITAERQLAFCAHGIGNSDMLSVSNHSDMILDLQKWGIPVNPHIQQASTIQDAISICKVWQSQRHQLDYQIDGMVVKVDQFDVRAILGTTGRAPRWCIAFKFPAELAQTQVISIDVQVGKSGILTPVANLSPVSLAGSVVKRASLHNFEELERLDVRCTDIVDIQKAGEIIPKIIAVHKDQRNPQAQPFPLPEQCPVCGTKARKDPEGVYIRCPNQLCPAQLRERLCYFVGRQQMDIEHFGPALIDQLLATDSIPMNNVADIYYLTREQLLPLERQADKSVDNILKAIEKSKTQPLWRLIAGLGIRHIGTQSAQILAQHFRSLDALLEASAENLEKIDQIGPTMAQSLVQYFSDPVNREVIQRLIKAGLKPLAPPPVVSTGHPLTGKIFVLTGTLSNMTRSQAQQALKEVGAKTSSSVSKKTDYVLAGDNAGSKLTNSKSLNIPILDEQSFLSLLEDSPINPKTQEELLF